jgi:hypothetical protein
MKIKQLLNQPEPNFNFTNAHQEDYKESDMLLDFNSEIQENMNKKAFDDFGRYEENFSNPGNQNTNGNNDWHPPSGPQ